MLLLSLIMFKFPSETDTSRSNPKTPSPDREHENTVTLKPDKLNRELPSRQVEFLAGVNFLVYGQPDILKTKKLFRHLRELGVNSLAIVYPLFQSGWRADEVTTDPLMTPGTDKLRALIRSAKAENFRVMLRPILDEKNMIFSGHWRGMIEPKNPETWFAGYRALILQYAELAAQEQAEILDIGTELNSLQDNRYLDEWIRLIEEVREIYRGELIYSFNWDCFREIPSTGFVSRLDYVGIDAYFPLDVSDDATIEDLEKAWGVWIDEVKNTVSGQLVITEVGMIPSAGAYHQPYIWDLPGDKSDWQAQANYYEATFSAWQPLTRGIYWWCVTADEPDSLFSPLGTPAEKVLEKYYLR